MIDFDTVVEKIITCAINIANAENNGFVVTNDSICLLNAIIITNNYKDIICDKLSDEQIENIYNLYKNTTNNNIFNQESHIDFIDYIKLNNR